jgi:serine/threonine-protein kinase
MIDVGSEVGSYRVLRPLGEGGMGRVFLAEHVRLQRKVALKVLLPEYSSRPAAVQRFFTEARAVNRIGHEHIVEVTDDGTSPSGEPFFVMELLGGETLAQRLAAGGAMPLWRALGIVVQVADALAASHATGIVHRDLKPENIFLITRHGDPDYVKVLDFGIAKLVLEVGELAEQEAAAPALAAPPAEGPGAESKTKTGAVLGTPFYMSPEQCRGLKEIDHRSDVYSLGIVLYQMVTGVVPFDADVPSAVLLQHVVEPFPKVRERVPGLPEAFELALERAVAKAPEERWQTMSELRQALAALLPDGGVRTTGPFGVTSAADGPLGAGSTPPAGTPAPPRPSARAAGTVSMASGELSAPELQAVPASAVERASRPAARRAVYGLAALVLVGGASTYAWLGRTPVPSPPAPAPAPAAAPAAPAAPALPRPPALAVGDAGAAAAVAGADAAEPAQVTLRVGSEPEGAGVFRFVDGALLGRTPYTHRADRSSAAAVFVLKLEGHREERLEIPLSADAERMVKLEPARNAAPAPPALRRKRSRFRSLGQ